jgi:hypothetical protein
MLHSIGTRARGDSKKRRGPTLSHHRSGHWGRGVDSRGRALARLVEQLDVAPTPWVRDSLGAGFLYRSLSPKINPLAGETEVRGFSKSVMTVNSCIKVHLDLQADKSPVVVKGPFFRRVVNPRYRIHGTNV